MTDKIPYKMLNDDENVLHQYDFGNEKGKFMALSVSDMFDKYLADDSLGHPEIQISSGIKIVFKATYLSEERLVKGFCIEKYRRTSGTWTNTNEKINLSTFTLSSMGEFLKFLNANDLESIVQKKIRLESNTINANDPSTNKTINTFLNTAEGLEMVEEIVKNGSITTKDIVNLGYRKIELEKFERFLSIQEYLQDYADKESLTDKKPEKIWQHFFNKNEWIFGYGLDYRFMTIFDREMSVGDGGTQNQDKADVDFIATFTDYTVLVEIKTPETHIFESKKRVTARSGTFSLSTSLFDAVSQCLEQKAEWQIKGNESGHTNKAGTQNLEQRTRDPKTILIFGNLGTELEKESNINVRKNKKDTFELFRRNLRNLEIITFDELYERAKFIIEKIEKNN